MAENPNSINFSFINIKTEQFVTFEENFDKSKEIKLNTNLSFGLNSEDKIFSISTKFTFEINNKPFVSIQLSCFFEIDKNNWESLITNGVIFFPKDFVAHMAMLTVGTSRGVLHAKTEGTIFNEFVLPTINVVDMIKEPISFDLNS